MLFKSVTILQNVISGRYTSSLIDRIHTGDERRQPIFVNLRKNDEEKKKKKKNMYKIIIAIENILVLL